MITTSRYASAETRRVARQMAADSCEAFAARGKRTIAQIVDLARRKGEASVTIVEERDGRPAAAATISIDGMGRWRWAGEKAIKARL